MTGVLRQQSSPSAEVNAFVDAVNGFSRSGFNNIETGLVMVANGVPDPSQTVVATDGGPGRRALEPVTVSDRKFDAALTSRMYVLGGDVAPVSWGTNPDGAEFEIYGNGVATRGDFVAGDTSNTLLNQEQYKDTVSRLQYLTFGKYDPNSVLDSFRGAVAGWFGSQLPAMTPAEVAEHGALRSLISFNIGYASDPSRYDPNLQQIDALRNGGPLTAAGFVGARLAGGDASDQLHATRAASAVEGILAARRGAYAASQANSLAFTGASVRPQLVPSGSTNTTLILGQGGSGKVANDGARSAYQYQLLKRDLLRQEIANPGNPMSGPVVLRDPVAGATPAQVQQIRQYADIGNLSIAEGYMSPTGRVSTTGTLRREASAAAAEERARAITEGRPYTSGSVVGHGLDTTWTGRPVAPFWLGMDYSINSSLGRQAQNYPLGYKPTHFIYQKDLNWTGNGNW
jgi:hypothetical protein